MGKNNQPPFCTVRGKPTLASKICNVHDSASLVVDCKSLTPGWISLSLYKVVLDSISLQRVVSNYPVVDKTEVPIIS